MRETFLKLADAAYTFMESVGWVPKATIEPEPESAAKPKSVKVASRAQLNKIINPMPPVNEGLNQAVDDEENTNDYQIILRKCGMRPFNLHQAASCFKQGDVMEALKILVKLEQEKLARRMDDAGTQWVLDKA